jgi:hypothetical protein
MFEAFITPHTPNEKGGMKPQSLPVYFLTLVVSGSLGCATSTQSSRFSAPCNGRTMATVVNLSPDAVEVVGVVGRTESVLAMAPPGLASPPFEPTRPADQAFVRPGEPRQAFWFIRNVATRRTLDSRDPQVRTEWVCVEKSSNTP